MAAIRIGAVSFLNTRPLVHGLQTCSDYTLSTDIPSVLAEKLRLGEIDAGLIPIVEYLRGVGDSLLPGICIASDGPVQSVKLFSRVHPSELTDVAVDSGSRSSVALLRILLAERFDVTPDFHIHRPDLAAMLRTHAAGLLVGDAAFTETGAPFIWDLGEAWKELTNLPFVYAVWTLREGVDAVRVGQWLGQAKEQGLQHLEAIARAAAGTAGLDAASILRYFRDSLRYTLGERELRGVEAFQKLCQRYNLVFAARELRFAGEARTAPASAAAKRIC